MVLTTILRGFKIPISILDRLLQANDMEPTGGYSPMYSHREVDSQSHFLRSKLGDDGKRTRIFIPMKHGARRSGYAYVAYAWVMVHAQRKINPAEDLPDRAPAGFAKLREEMMWLAEMSEDELMQVEGVKKGEAGEDLSTAMYVVVTDDRDFPSIDQYMKKSELRCDHCDEIFESWYARQHHRKDEHGCVLNSEIPNW